jgi:hypothetical protein
MSTTTLFVELLVIGVGTATWLVLFFLALTQSQFKTDYLTIIPKDNLVFIGVVVAISYVLGIVIDRLMHHVFRLTIEKWARARTREVIGPDELAKFVKYRSEALSSKIDHNRSRFRICRAWVFHFIIIGIGLWYWNYRVNVFDSSGITALVLADALFVVLTLLATYLLAKDHVNDLIQSREIIIAVGNIDRE